MPPKRLSKKVDGAVVHQNKQPSVSPAKNQSLLSFTATQQQLQPVAGKLKSARRQQNGSSTSKAGSTNTSKPLKAVSQTDSSIDADPPRVGGIQSFFNAATQRQQDSSPRSGRAATPVELTEAIDSDEERSGLISLSKGSSTALALRKRKSHRSNGLFAGENSRPLSASQKFRRTENGRVPMMNVVNDDKRPWIDQFAPQTVEDLAVHKRKVADVRGWLDLAYVSRHNRALVLKGPAGSGKTTTLRLLAKDMNIQVLEWSNPAGRDLTGSSRAETSQFEDFLARAGRSNGLTFAEDDEDPALEIEDATEKPRENTRQLILIEEFPSTFSKASPALQSFRSAIAQHLATRGSIIPLVLVVSETLLSTSTAAADSFTTHRLLGAELTIHPYITTIEFNAIAPTILLKALESVVVQEARKSGRRTTPGPAVLKRLTEFGDVRSAVSTLEFLCLRGDRDDIWSSKVVFSKPKKKARDAQPTDAEVEALAWIASRESTLGIWHGVGKVLYNKRTEPTRTEELGPTPPWQIEYQRSLLPENNANDLVVDIGTDTSTFVAALHENYLLSCAGVQSRAEQTLTTVSECVSGLSDCDLLSLDRLPYADKLSSATDTMRQDEISFQVGVRGLLYHLPMNAKRSAPTNGPRVDAHRMYYPASLKLWRKQDEIEAAIEALRLRMRSQLRQARPRATTAYSLANTNATPWIDDSEQDEAANNNHPRLESFTLTPKDLFVTNVPYLYSPIRKWTDDKILLDLIRTVTQIRGNPRDDLRDVDDPDEPEDTAAMNQWTTDHTEGDTTSKKIRPRIMKKSGTTFDNGPLSAEQQIEALVLEDDDIEDD